MFEVMFSASQNEIRTTVRAFTEKEIIPVAAEYDRRAQSPLHLYNKFYGEGWMSRFLPGGDLDATGFLVNACIVAEELAYGCAGIAGAIMVPIFANRLILLNGSEELRSEVRRRLAQGPVLTSFAATEEEAGSDLMAIQTRARRSKEGYSLSGKKAFCSNIRHAHYVIVVARTGEEDSRSTSAFSLLVVPTDSPGVVVGEAWQTLGLRSVNVSPVRFEDVQVPESYRLGEEGEGLSVMMKTLNQSRTGIAAIAVGIARRARDVILNYSRRRRLYGDKLYKLQDYRFQIAEMESDIAGSRALVWVSAAKNDRGLDNSKENAIAKLVAGQMVMRVTGAASIMMGGLGYTREALVEKLFRDARYVGIVEGPEPVQKELIFAEMLRQGVY